jgi:hypothetical protein
MSNKFKETRAALSKKWRDKNKEYSGLYIKT